MDLIRVGLDMPKGRWKAVLVAMSLMSLVAMGIEAASAVAAFERGSEGRLGLQTDGVWHEGRVAHRVREIETWSLAPQAGVHPGDVIVADRWYDMYRSRLPGEAVGATIVRPEASFHAELIAAPRPIEPLDIWHFALNAGLCALGTVFGLVIGLRQASVPTSRALALAFVWWSANLGSSYALPHWPQVLLGLLFEFALAPGWYLGLWFAIHYPDEQPQGWRRALRRLLPVLLVALVAVQAVTVAAALGRLPFDIARSAQTAYIGTAGALMLVAFWDGWRRSSGALRQRFNWLLGSFSLLWAVSYLSFLTDILGSQSWNFVGHVSVLGSLAALLGLMYAVLRHRVLDMGLALNRSLVIAVVGAVLLGSFQFLQVVTGRLLHFDDPAKAGLLTAMLAVLVLLAYPKVKPRAEWLVDRLFFGDWVRREADLARFVDDARGYSDASALGEALVEAVDRFTGGAGAALYVRDADGSFAHRAGTPQLAPPMLDADEPLAVSLRAAHALARRDEVHSRLPAELALVLSRQRDLEAFVLVGRRDDGTLLREDEIAALRDALRRIGAEWQALRWQAALRELGVAPPG